MSNNDPYAQEGEMSFLQHLEVLRWHLVRSAIAIAIGAVVAFIFGTWITDTIIMAQMRPDFPTFQWMCQFSAKLNEWFPDLFEADIVCIGQNIPQNLKNLTMAGQFMSHIWLALICGIIIAFPYVVWEVWRFVNPALQTKERRMARGFVFFVTLLFGSGIAFAYWILSPLTVNFFMTYHLSDNITNDVTFSSYVTIITTVVLGCGLVFQLPILIYFLSKLGLVTPRLMRKYRKHAIIGCLILSSIITPPDVFSQLLVSVPLFFLYEISILISRSIARKREAEA